MLLSERCRALAQRCAAIERELGQPETVSDRKRFLEKMREHRRLSPVARAWQKYAAAQAAMEEARAILACEADEELCALAREELSHALLQAETLERELNILLLPKDEDDDRSVIVEIRSGAGGEEAALFASNLYRMYRMYADSLGWQTTIVSANETELGGFKEISFFVEGEGAYAKMKYESGVHRVQRVPETESQGRIQTSTATVAVLPEIEDVEIDIPPADIKMETCKSSGAGGQHINKTESAVRIIHLPTGMVVECQEERSQFKNRDKAMKLLRSRLYEMEKERRDAERAGERRSQIGTGDRSEKIRTYNFPQRRMTDHRIGLTLYTLEDIMNGALDGVVGALAEADLAKKLQAAAEGRAEQGDI